MRSVPAWRPGLCSLSETHTSVEHGLNAGFPHLYRVTLVRVHLSPSSCGRSNACRSSRMPDDLDAPTLGRCSSKQASGAMSAILSGPKLQVLTGWHKPRPGRRARPRREVASAPVRLEVPAFGGPAVLYWCDTFAEPEACPMAFYSSCALIWKRKTWGLLPFPSPRGAPGQI